MRKLLNTLYITSENAYASLDGENVVVRVDQEEKGRFPLHILESIYLFSYAGASPALIGKCAERGVDIVFCTPAGQFLSHPSGRSSGCGIARNMILGKVMNEKHVLDRCMRDHADRIDRTRFLEASKALRSRAELLLLAENTNSLRGLEGTAATEYFALFDSMILREREVFYFNNRNRRPPLDPVNALLSYVYMMVTGMCSAALETVGLDPYVGFLHTDRPGRASMALDLVEELRPCLADRFVLSLINNGMISRSDFEYQDSGAVYLNADGKKKVHKAWQQRKQEQIIHPYIREKVEWGLIPYVQAMLLARMIRGDLDGYPPFIWK